jgi:hypothetical protein
MDALVNFVIILYCAIIVLGVGSISYVLLMEALRFVESCL